MTRLKSLIAAFVFFSVVFVGTHVAKFPGSLSHLMMVTHDQPILDLKASFSSAETYQRLEAFGEVGRGAYVTTMLTIDTIFPISAFLFLFMLARYTTERLNVRPKQAWALWGVSIAYLAFDFLENVTVAVLLANFPERLDFLASNIGFLTMGKRIAMTGAFILPVALLSIAQASLLAGRCRAKSA